MARRSASKGLWKAISFCSNASTSIAMPTSTRVILSSWICCTNKPKRPFWMPRILWLKKMPSRLQPSKPKSNLGTIERARISRDSSSKYTSFIILKYCTSLESGCLYSWMSKMKLSLWGEKKIDRFTSVGVNSTTRLKRESSLGTIWRLTWVVILATALQSYFIGNRGSHIVYHLRQTTLCHPYSIYETKCFVYV